MLWYVGDAAYRASARRSRSERRIVAGQARSAIMALPMNRRRQDLDALRAVAVLLVMLFHFPPMSPDVWAVVRVPFDFGARIGWMGVDLFFVLSGFLVSGLLFQEYQRLGTVDWWNFFCRRGLKIYPAFYVFLTLTVAVSTMMGDA